jgi:hypothetical protein
MFLRSIDQIRTHISSSDPSSTINGRCSSLRGETLTCASLGVLDVSTSTRRNPLDYSSSRWMDAWPSYVQLDRYAFEKIVINTCIHADIVQNRRPTTLRDACSSSRIPGRRHGIGTWRDNFADVGGDAGLGRQRLGGWIHNACADLAALAGVSDCASCAFQMVSNRACLRCQMPEKACFVRKWNPRSSQAPSQRL